ncbi:histidine phosphatase family protein [Blastococcus jejuensis]|uniref:Histidine phosphatase family protein n=1 Tax=Blastococcus jejuensis TaxID=351224 RepID=A0ABP6P8D1_9ACTN
MVPRRLVLIRHAKAAGGAVDADRPPTEGGTRQAAAIGPWLEQAGLVPDRVLVSPARRAAQTWEAAAPTSAARPTTEPRIYDNTVEALLAAIRETPDDVSTLALVGHNPSIGELAHALDDGQGSPAARQALDAGFPTGAVAVFVVGGSFGELEPGGARVSDFARPEG